MFDKIKARGLFVDFACKQGLDFARVHVGQRPVGGRDDVERRPVAQVVAVAEDEAVLVRRGVPARVVVHVDEAHARLGVVQGERPLERAALGRVDDLNVVCCLDFGQQAPHFFLVFFIFMVIKKKRLKTKTKNG